MCHQHEDATRDPSSRRPSSAREKCPEKNKKHFLQQIPEELPWGEKNNQLPSGTVDCMHLPISLLTLLVLEATLHKQTLWESSDTQPD